MSQISNGLHAFLAELSREAYERQTFKTHEVEGLLGRASTEYSETTQIISVRGTEFTGALKNGGMLDILRDLLVLPKYAQDIGVGHWGFLSGARRVLIEILDDLDPSLPIICTGHSMGAAVSLALSRFLIRQGFNVVEWVGFGAPRVFAKKLDWGDTQITHYQYGRDLITEWLPPGLIYQHQVPAIKIGKPKYWLPNLHDHNVDLYAGVI